MKKLTVAVLMALASTGALAENRAFITLEGEMENIHNTGDDVTAFTLIPGAKLDNGFTVDLKTQVSTKEGARTNSANIEPRIRYDYKIGMTDFTAWGRLGLGEKIQNGGNFGYYTIEPGISYNVIKGGKLFVSDRFRDAFSDGKGYQTNTLYLGGSYDVNSFDTVSAKLYRKYEDTESNGIEVAYTRWF